MDLCGWPIASMRFGARRIGSWPGWDHGSQPVPAPIPKRLALEVNRPGAGRLPDEFPRYVLQFPQPGLGHAEVDLLTQNVEGPLHPVFAPGNQSIACRSADEGEIRAQGE